MYFFKVYAWIDAFNILFNIFIPTATHMTWLMAFFSQKDTYQVFWAM